MSSAKKGSGVDYSAAAGEATNFAFDVMKNINDSADRKRARYKMGILYPDEKRDLFVTTGKVPAIFSSSSIRMGLKEGNLPPGWTELTAILQGFGAETSELLDRLQSETVSGRKLLQQKLEATEQQIKSDYKNMYLDALGRRQVSFYQA